MAHLYQLLSINTRLVLVQSKSSTFWLVSKEIQAESVPHAKISTDGEKNSSSMLPTLPSFPIFSYVSEVLDDNMKYKCNC